MALEAAVAEVAEGSASGRAAAAGAEEGRSEGSECGKKGFERKPREVVLGPDGKPLSRNAIRKMRRDAAWAAKAEERKLKRKAKNKEMRAKKRARIQAGDRTGRSGVAWRGGWGCSFSRLSRPHPPFPLFPPSVSMQAAQVRREAARPSGKQAARRHRLCL